MSDIKRYGVWDKPPREDLVTYADHEAAIALRTRVCAEAFEDELARTEERVLADAKARIEGERIESDGMDSWENGYHTGIDAALAALTQKGEGNDGLYADQNCCVHCGWITCAGLEDCLATEGDNES